MITRSLESCAKGMVALLDMNDNIANNLSNVNTYGFKKGSLRKNQTYIIDENNILYEMTMKEELFETVLKFQQRIMEI